MMNEETELIEDVQPLEEEGQHIEIASMSNALDKVNVSVRLVLIIKSVRSYLRDIHLTVRYSLSCNDGS